MTAVVTRPVLSFRTSLSVIAAIIVAYGVAAIVAAALLFTTSKRQRSENRDVKTDYENLVARECFSADRLEDRNVNSNVSRRREVQKNLLGPLVPVDCQKVNRYCLKPENCKLFCKDAAVVPFDCTNGVCVQKAVDTTKPTGSDQQSPCDTKNGEYGLLVGYNDLGIAQWECIQLYPAWQDRKSYCQNGRLDLDVRAREPSYRDCTCSEGTTRMVYKKSVLGQTVFGLPYCVPNNVVKFYELSYAKV
jgi:hypothetical protein